MINLTVDDRTIGVEPGSSVLEACRAAGRPVPALCHHPALPAYGACRLCLVEVQERSRSRITASCLYPARDGLVVRTATEQVVQTRRIMAELLLARCPGVPRVREVAAGLGVTESRFPPKNEDCILCGLCTRVCSELMKTGAVDFASRGNRRTVGPAYDRSSPVCMACGACAVVCPTGAAVLQRVSARPARPIPSEFDAGLASRPSIYIPYPQAIPKAAVIDRSTCAHFGRGAGADACKVCQSVCEAHAIDYDQEEAQVELDVGAVVIAPGFQLCDHRLRAEYGFGQYPNVISSLQFERVLSASGPSQGRVQRPSDGKEPRRIASIQCVGSREEEANYCSSVCCMYASKHALMAKEHLPGVEYTIFFMDLRAFGKGFDAYYQRAQDEGVRFVRARPATVEEAGEDHDLRIK
jgi:heterodisulfide reductase subunit A